MTEYNLEASIRENMTKSHRKDLLSRGMVPAIINGKTVGSLPLEVSGKELSAAVRSGRNTIINLAVSGNGGPYKVMVRELQFDPLKKGIIHADFQQISLLDKIHTAVPVNISGEAAGGMPQLVLRQLEITCLPADIPSQFTVDVSGMKAGDSVAVHDLAVPEGVSVVTDPGTTVVTVLSQKEEAVEKAAGEAGEAGEDEKENAPENGNRK
ncbi:MAG: hypothetical protein VR68_07295 [Peptococcaceae bacterium BRH_c4a]|nr:MAG: hypothetical protein VR68_07295 [Peptococcaceae bacterium BRH_c4a]